MKHTLTISIILVLAVALVLWPKPQTFGKNEKAEISYNNKPFMIKQLNMDFEKQWDQVLRNYPAVAIAFMYKEAALAMFVYNRQDIVKKYPSPLPHISNTSVAAAIGPSLDPISVDKTICIDKLIDCDLRASQDGSVSVDEVRGCSNLFSNCWTGSSD